VLSEERNFTPPTRCDVPLFLRDENADLHSQRIYCKKTVTPVNKIMPISAFPEWYHHTQAEQQEGGGFYNPPRISSAASPTDVIS